MITRKDYMANSAELHHAYYLQFATEATKRFVLEHIGMVERSLDIRPPEPPPVASERLRATLAPVSAELQADSVVKSTPSEVCLKAAP